MKDLNVGNYKRLSAVGPTGNTGFLSANVSNPRSFTFFVIIAFSLRLQTVTLWRFDSYVLNSKAQYFHSTVTFPVK
jgi:hypothetical protein